MKISLIIPTLDLKKEALEYRQEHFDNGETIINGSELFDQTDSYEQWLDTVKKNADPKTVSEQWVVTDTFFAINDNGDIVGIIDLRHTLNDFLADFGHTGYSVRPSQRRKGYATQMLRQLIEVAKLSGLTELQLSVERNNGPSVKTIISNGGVYERSFTYEGKEADIYKIAINQAI